MANEKTRADSIRFYLSSAAAQGGVQADPDASLGGFRSCTQIHSLGFTRVSAIRNIAILECAGANGRGQGSLAVVDDDELAWTPPGDAIGTAVAILEGETKLIEGSDPDKWIRVYRKTDEALSGQETVILADVINNLLGFDNVSSAEAAAGDLEYRSAFIKNESTDSVDNLTAFLAELNASVVSNTTQLGASGAGTLATTGSIIGVHKRGFIRIETSGGTLREIVYYSSVTAAGVFTIPAEGRGLAGTTPAAGASTDVLRFISGYRIAKEAPVADEIQTIANESTAPTGVTWNTGYSAATGISIGTLAAGAEYGLQLERIVPAGMVGDPNMPVIIGYEFDDVNIDTFTGKLRGRFRVANDALRRYEIYRGVDGSPDYAAAAFDTFTVADLPRESATVLTDDAVNQFVIRERNEYNLLSQNTEELVEHQYNLASGADIGAKPHGPVNVQVKSAAGGKITVIALYNPSQDAAAIRADAFAIWVTDDGTTPDMDGDPATTEVAMATAGLMPRPLAWTSTAVYPDATTVKVGVRTRRTGTPDVDSANTEIVTEVTSAVQPPILKAGIFYGPQWEQFTEAYQVGADETYWIDEDENIGFIPDGESVSFYAGADLVWRFVKHLDGIYIPNDWVLSGQDAIGTAGVADAFEVINWNGAKEIGVNVAGVRRLFIDVTNKRIAYVKRSGQGTLETAIGGSPVWEMADKIVFAYFQACNEAQWTAYGQLETDGTWRSGFDTKRQLTQAEIEAL